MLPFGLVLDQVLGFELVLVSRFVLAQMFELELMLVTVLEQVVYFFIK